MGNPPPQHAVEFMGIPGSGKSTLAAALHTRLSARYAAALPAREQYRRRRLSAWEAAAVDLRYTRRLLGYRARRVAAELRSGGSRRSALLRGWERSRYPALLLDLMAREPAQVYVLDEWLVHKAIFDAIRRYPDDRDFCSRFGVLPDRRLRMHYVSVGLDVETALHRIDRQDQPHRGFVARPGAVTIVDLLRSWHYAWQRMQDELTRRGYPVLRVDGRTAVDANAEAIAAWLEPQIPWG